MLNELSEFKILYKSQYRLKIHCFNLTKVFEDNQKLNTKILNGCFFQRIEKLYDQINTSTLNGTIKP